MKVSITLHEIDVSSAKHILDCCDASASVTDNDVVEVNEQTSSPEVTPTVSEESNDTVGVELDKEGLPWDARIHSSNGKKTSKGVWQRKRNLNELTYTTVKNELLGLEAAPVTSVMDEEETVESVRTYDGLIAQINTLFASGKIQFTYAQQIVEEINHSFEGVAINNITQIQNDQGLIDFVWDLLERDGNA